MKKESLVTLLIISVLIVNGFRDISFAHEGQVSTGGSKEAYSDACSNCLSGLTPPINIDADGYATSDLAWGTAQGNADAGCGPSSTGPRPCTATNISDIGRDVEGTGRPVRPINRAAVDTEVDTVTAE